MTVKRSRMLDLVPEIQPTPPPTRGRLMSPEEVTAEKFQGHVTLQWVRRNVRPKVRLGHSTVMFFELDVDTWIGARRNDAGA